MAKGRSTYTFNVINQNSADQIIKQWLSANSFEWYDKKGEQFYRGGSSFTGYKGLLYSFNGQTLNITAWIITMQGDYSLEQKMINGITVQINEYKKSLNSLFASLNSLASPNINPINQGPETAPVQAGNNQVNTQPNSNLNTQNNTLQQTSNNFNSEVNKKNETLCEVGFWISIVGIVLAFMGVTFGVIIYIFEYYFAAVGLKTKKRGKAITTIVLATLSILIIVMQLIALGSHY